MTDIKTAIDHQFQSPSLRGSGRFRYPHQSSRRLSIVFQSPSLRGSGRFLDDIVFIGDILISFNPLHCGAVVASDKVIPAIVEALEVSIPFIAGQWSLLRRRDGGGGAARGFNPLHCGAVVASQTDRPPPSGGEGCFNPLHCGAVVASSFRVRLLEDTVVSGFNPLHCGAVVASLPAAGGGAQARLSQSPSLRGSGRFTSSRPWPATGPCLNPLHCGAVVASGQRGRAPVHRSDVSIPFIAGQWSLHVPGTRLDPFLRGLNPLHCGAVVASPPAHRRSHRASRLNPLHCGAVVASDVVKHVDERTLVFQSPSLRGSGRFSCAARLRLRRRACFNPLHCGAVVASMDSERATRLGNQVSIPFIAGQWSLRAAWSRQVGLHAMFQSPSLRGSGRFRRNEKREQQRERVSIPFIAGQWSLHIGFTDLPDTDKIVSIPFIAGQWSLPAVALVVAALAACLNPLHCGAVVASAARRGRARRTAWRSQSPSLRGSGRFGRMRPAPETDRDGSQSPSLRGSGRFTHRAADR